MAFFVVLALALALIFIFMCLRRRLARFGSGGTNLFSGGTKLYHQTDDESATIILRTQQIKPGNGGVAGGGIYFATTPELTGHNAHKHAVILEATVDLGRILEAAGNRYMTLQRLQSLGFDSVCIAGTVSRGQEYVVYDPKRVRSIRWHAPASPPPPAQCAAGCGHFGRPETGGMCSKCYKRMRRSDEPLGLHEV